MSAVQSYVSLQCCLTWETERPCVGRPRTSSSFVLFGQECYLQMSLENYSEANLDFRVKLFRSGGEKSLETRVVVSCHIIAENLVLRDFPSFNYKRPVRKSGDDVFDACVPKASLPADHRCGVWTMYCRLICEKPLTLHTGNKTIHMSTVKDASPLTVDKCVKASTGVSSVNRCVQASPETPRDIESLAADFSTLLQDENFSDFELKCRGRVFRVHRNVLAARSEVFRAMFRNPMRESESRSADIEDLEVPVLESMIKYIYAGTLEPVHGEETVFKMYQAADKYAVHSLKSACSCWMTMNLTQKNCVRFLDVAESHSDRDLRAAVESFILEHPGVLKTEAWLAFSKQHLELANEIFQTFVSSIVQ